MASFEDIAEISKLLKQNKTNLVEIQISPAYHTTLFKEFFDGIVFEKICDDKSAKLYLYGQKKSSSSYLKLKNRFFQKLLNSLFFLDLKRIKNNTYGQAYLDSYKKYSCIRILLGLYARGSAISLCEKLIKKTIKYQFTDLTLEISRILKLHYSTLNLDKKKYEYFSSITLKYKEIQESEIIAEEIYCNISQNFTNSTEQSPLLIKEAKAYKDKAEELLRGNISYKIALYSYSVIIIFYELECDLVNVIHWSNLALKYFTPKLLSSSAKFAFNFKILNSYLKLGFFKEANYQIQDLKKFTPDNSINWYLLHSYEYILHIHTGNYSSAKATIQSIYANKHLSRMPPQIQERWRIYEAYTQYLIAIKKLDGRKSRKFRLHKFLNEVPIYSRDKRGTNITILILHILFMLEQKDYSRIYDRIEALKLYHRRYLRHNDTLRSNCFIRMLVLLIETDFHRERMEHRAKRYLNKMQSRPIATASQSTELEIIPYPVLWQYVLDSLG